MNTEIQFTVTLFKKFVKAYKLAVKENKESFMFEGSEWSTAYAKYVIEYLTPKFNTYENNK